MTRRAKFGGVALHICVRRKRGHLLLSDLFHISLTFQSTIRVVGYHLCQQQSPCTLTASQVHGLLIPTIHILHALTINAMQLFSHTCDHRHGFSTSGTFAIHHIPLSLYEPLHSSFPFFLPFPLRQPYRILVTHSVYQHQNGQRIASTASTTSPLC